MRVFGTPASIDVQASVWRMFLISTQNAAGTTDQYYGYKWNRMYEGFGTKLADASSWSASSYPGILNTSFSISPNNSYIANVYGSGTIRVKARPFIKSGIAEGPGTEFSLIDFPQRGTTTPTAIQWNSAETAAFWGRNVSPYIFASSFSASGWGTLYSAPVTAAPSTADVAINLSTNEVAANTDVGGGVVSSINAWTFSTATGWGSKLSDPAAGFPTGGGIAPSFSKNGDAIVCSGGGSPYIWVYPWIAGTGFGTKYADPADISFFSTVAGMNFNPSQTVLGLVTGPGFVQPSLFFQWSSSTGFGTKYVSTAGMILKPTWSPDGKSVGGGAQGTDTLTYPWNDSTGFGTQYSNPAQPLSSLGTYYEGFFSN
jgi:hypothetical protein